MADCAAVRSVNCICRCTGCTCNTLSWFAFVCWHSISVTIA